MKRLVVYSDQNMTISRKRCIESGLKHGIDEVHEWDEEMLHATEFYQLNPDIFIKGARGAGCFWLFKSFIIYKALLDMTENDYLIYSDSGVEFINDVSHIINVMNEDIFLFGNNWNHVDWCKGDALQAILPEWNGHYSINSFKQVQASVIFIRPTQKAKDFIKSWLCYCMMPGLIDDSPSKVPNYPTFREGRHDQAIITCLAIKYGIRLHWWCATYNDGAFNYDKIQQYQSDNYPIIFHHHRRRNEEWK